MCGGEVSAWLGDLKSRRIVVEVCDDLCREIRIIGVVERSRRIYELKTRLV